MLNRKNGPRRTKPRFNYEISLSRETEKGRKSKATWHFSYAGKDESDVREQVRRSAERAARKRESERDGVANMTVEKVELLETVPIPS